MKSTDREALAELLSGNFDTFWVDLDDTLWDFSANSLSTLAQLYEIHRLSRFFDTVELWQQTYLRHNHKLWEQYNIGAISAAFLQTERFIRPLLEGGAAETEARRLTDTLHTEYLDILGTYSRLVDGARELLETIKSHGFRTAILSNGFKEVQFKKLASSGIESLIDIVVLSDEIGVNKPDLRIFSHALKRASTTAGRSIIIGDNPSTDIAGGCRAGWATIYFNKDFKGQEAEVPTVEVGSLREITAAINQLFPDSQPSLS